MNDADRETRRSPSRSRGSSLPGWPSGTRATGSTVAWCGSRKRDAKPAVADEGLRRFIWQECQFDGERVTVRGVLRDVELHEHLVINANGGDIEVVVVKHEWPGSKIEAVDVASYRGQHTVIEAFDFDS